MELILSQPLRLMVHPRRRCVAGIWEEGTPMSTASDRNLLLGIIAMQMDFISPDALIAAMHAWILRKGTPLSRYPPRPRGLDRVARVAAGRRWSRNTSSSTRAIVRRAWRPSARSARYATTSRRSSILTPRSAWEMSRQRRKTGIPRTRPWPHPASPRTPNAPHNWPRKILISSAWPASGPRAPGRSIRLARRLGLSGGYPYLSCCRTRSSSSLPL